jgi:hypothetical protein
MNWLRRELNDITRLENTVFMDLLENAKKGIREGKVHPSQ